MNHIGVIKHMTSALASRKEVFDVSLDRGRGQPTRIEDWIITEMLAKLIELRDQRVLDRVEGEHPYPLTKNPNSPRRAFERCDFWWELKGTGHWLEVKTVNTRDAQRYLDEISKDLQKTARLGPGDIAHHLAIVYPLPLSRKGHWRDRLTALYGDCDWKLEADWDYPVWETDTVTMFVFSLR